ncbi:diguanylate cyclase [Oxalobacteraceae bacterium]|nr:diguanylate cyclase [Oxalobacteraceae bacterium]
MPATPPLALAELLMRDIAQSENGIAVLDPDNIFLYHNHAFAHMFGLLDDPMIGRSNDDMMTLLYTKRSGPKIQSGSLQEWLDLVHSRQRSERFRSFEVDLVDGRWLLLSEQVHEGGEVVMLCTDITRQKMIELDLKQAHADLERLAMTDELTGIPNRRNFLQRLDAELVRAQRYRHPVCLAMLDLDHFKRVNDTYGHPAGDEVLRHFTRFLVQHLRNVDIVGRLGGEEFAVILPETKLDDALFVLRRVIALLDQETVEAVAPGFQYGFSGGVAMAVDTGTECKWLLASADQALYQAKTGGRRQIRAWQDEPANPDTPA